MLLLEYKGKIYTCEYCGKRTINKSSYCFHVGNCRKKTSGEPRYKVKRKCKRNKSRVNNSKVYKCICGKEVIGVQNYAGHCSFCRKRRELLGKSKRTHKSWNKGLTKETSEAVRKSIETFKKNEKLGLHNHPLPKDYDSWRKKISSGMKKAHSEGRAWNLAKNRWKNEPSYPEKFFMKVIDNEFINKNYQREYHFFTFSLDFAWINEKKCIEIDGEQHDRFQWQKECDIRKDKKLIENGWKVLRIKWTDMCKDTKYWIHKAKDFIDN